MNLQKAPSVNTEAGIPQSVQLLGYGLDNEGIKIRFPPRPRVSPIIHRVQSGSGAHPTSCAMGTGRPPPPEVKRPWREKDQSSNLLPRLRKNGVLHLLSHTPAPERLFTFILRTLISKITKALIGLTWLFESCSLQQEI